MKKILKLTSILLLFVSIVSCDDYLDVNDTIDDPTLENVDPNRLFVGTQTLTAENYADELNRVGNWMGVAWSGNYNAFNDAYGDESRYLLSSTFYNEVWDNTYRFASNFAAIERYNDGRNWNNQKAAAKISRAFYMQYIVDLYGNVPFSEAFKGGENLFNKYDDAESIYKNLISLTDEAIQLIDNGANSEDFGRFDIVFGGHMPSWKQFAQTLKLRLLTRLVLKARNDGGDLLTYVNTKFAELNTAQFISQDVTVNPGYANADNIQNPFWETYGFNVAGVPTNQGRQTGPSQFAFDLLTNSNDNRLNRLWRPNIISGHFTATQQNGTGNSASIGVGVLKGADARLPIMLAAESYFLQAEAVERGYLTGNAKALFDQGVTASFNTLGASGAATYISNNDSNIDLGYNGGDALRAIITQKWIALTSVSGAELWIEYNRTGFPANLPLPSGSTDPNIPVRLLYPASEYSGNSSNVVNQSRSDGFSSKIFWDVN